MRTILFLIFAYTNVFAYTYSYTFIKSVSPSVTFLRAERIISAVDKYHPLVESFISKETFYEIMALESRFKTTALSKDKQDTGLFQIRKSTYRLLYKAGWITLYEPDRLNEIEYNMYVATVLLRVKKIEVLRNFRVNDKKKLEKLILISYNKGINQLKEDYYVDGRKDLHNYKYIKKLRRLSWKHW